VGTEALISQSIQLQVKETIASLHWYQKSGGCAESCARRSVCLRIQSGGGASISLLKLWVWWSDWSSKDYLILWYSFSLFSFKIMGILWM